MSVCHHIDRIDCLLKNIYSCTRADCKGKVPKCEKKTLMWNNIILCEWEEVEIFFHSTLHCNKTELLIEIQPHPCIEGSGRMSNISCQLYSILHILLNTTLLTTYRTYVVQEVQVHIFIKRQNFLDIQ